MEFAKRFGFSAGYVEKLYADYLGSPDAVPQEWKAFFDEFGDPDGRRKIDSADSAEPGPASPPPDLEPMRGIAAAIAQNMEESLAIPTATSARDVPMRVLEENRRIVNHHLAKACLGKLSVTHVIGWAVVEALRANPAMTTSFVTWQGKPHRRRARRVNLGVAVDMESRDGTRGLVVPMIRDTFALDFADFVAAYDDVIERARSRHLTPEDFQETTCTLTNPGVLGTVGSLPRLMQGQSFILATGAITVPASYRGASPVTLAELGIGRAMTVTSTYDHRVIQGAVSGEFLATMDALLCGERSFYQRIFDSLKVPHRPLAMVSDRHTALGVSQLESEKVERAAKVMQYVRAYRVRGYLLADLDPLHYEAAVFSELELDSYGLTLWDLDREFLTGGATGKPLATLREIRETLEDTYARHIGVEYMHIADPDQKEWLRDRMETTKNEEPLSRDSMLRVLDKLVEAEAFERFLHTRFVGHKRFSIEGCETLIPVVDALLLKAAGTGVRRAVMGMTHRGRLNVLVHILGKKLTKIFEEFEGHLDPDAPQGSGDVKYHLGARGTYECGDGVEVQIELASNPSHLEAVDPVVEGMARARQTRPDGTTDRVSVLPILIHGDAAFAGQGVVAETLNMSQLRGYRAGGTVHIIVNNQIGYTTLPVDARSSPFCTDVAKSIQAPIFHVNGDDPLAAVRMVRMAVDYRQAFGRDVVLDIVCYRRWGHNEGDEPSFTQPLLYKAIENHRSAREVYQDYLVRAGVLEPQDVDGYNDAVRERLRTSLDEVRNSTQRDVEVHSQATTEPAWDFQGGTAVPEARILRLAERLVTVEDGFEPHPKITRLLESRGRMARGEIGVDFAFAETLAFATLLTEGTPIRLAGQDSGRGTFSQRHAVLLDVNTGGRWIPLQYLSADQAPFLVIDSLLSEEAALGFEYGYSVVRPNGLTLWEAQFGDFANGAQVQIDQFIAAGEAKWGQACGLVLLLPHGYDGQGPEHSSARLERFLQLCAQGNMRVANPSTPAQLFHLLRQQALDPVKKPLVVMTAKSLLRMKAASSSVKDLVAGGFDPVLDEPLDFESDGPQRVVLCSGKIYYELLAERARAEIDGVALIRIEQMYPFPESRLRGVLSRYDADDLLWCQEEPENMGAWSHVRWRVAGLRYVGRPASASPAIGSLRQHKADQRDLVRRALTLAS